MNNMTIHVYSLKDEKIGSYKSLFCPRVGEGIDANNGHWIVRLVQHQINASLEPVGISTQSECVVYVSKEIME